MEASAVPLGFCVEKQRVLWYNIHEKFSEKGAGVAMKYYVVSDIHGFYSKFHSALENAGFFADTEPHKLVVLGDLFDRGREARMLQSFILERMEKDEVILIRGNHEDLFVDLVTTDCGMAYRHHKLNGTYDTALQLTGFDAQEAFARCAAFADAAQKTPFYQQILPVMVDYFETKHYVFVHGWIPCHAADGEYRPHSDWRAASPFEWQRARWYNGMDAIRGTTEEKTIVCGHWHASYGHARYEGKGGEFDEGADFSPYYAPGIIAVDGCTAYSGLVNIVVLEDEPGIGG